MKQILIFIVLVFFSFNNGYSDDWKVKNKWKISCGVVDKEALIVNGKPKKYSKKEFKLIDVVFKLDKGMTKGPAVLDLLNSLELERKSKDL